MGYKVMGTVVTQLGFEIPIRDQYSADRGAGKGQTDYFTGLKTLNLIVLQPLSPHQYNNSAIVVGQGRFHCSGWKTLPWVITSIDLYKSFCHLPVIAYRGQSLYGVHIGRSHGVVLLFYPISLYLRPREAIPPPPAWFNDSQ
jgi:hypothetical protein